MFPLGIGIAASTLVGNALGAGKVALAKELSHLSLGVMISLSAIICPTMALGGDWFMSLFTSDESVLVICRTTLNYLVYSALIDGLQGVCSGILRGAGKQHIGAVTNIVAFYVLGLPCAWILCFRYNLGVQGLMTGILVGSSFQTAVLLYFVLFMDSYVFTALVKECGSSLSPVETRRHDESDNHDVLGPLENPSTIPMHISSSCVALAPNHMLISGV